MDGDKVKKSSFMNFDNYQRDEMKIFRARLI